MHCPSISSSALSTCLVDCRLKTEGGLSPLAPTVLAPEWKAPPEDMDLPGAQEEAPPPDPLSHADALSPAALAGDAQLAIQVLYHLKCSFSGLVSCPVPWWSDPLQPYSVMGNNKTSLGRASVCPDALFQPSDCVRSSTIPIALAFARQIQLIGRLLCRPLLSAPRSASLQAGWFEAANVVKPSIWLSAGVLDVWDFRTRFSPLHKWGPPPTLEVLQAAAAAADGEPSVALELLRPLMHDVRPWRPPPPLRPPSPSLCDLPNSNFARVRRCASYRSQRQIMYRME